ncbi:ABC transporter substrate-binding protein [Candidatus Lokiarchaeum ossiferum]|uniref:ABC transporter substrate-binding protein n=1 Tax=Candidatus Lokiarchaeum ossiferum TaxID=2951803 RepID=UPI00352C33CA
MVEKTKQDLPWYFKKLRTQILRRTIFCALTIALIGFQLHTYLTYDTPFDDLESEKYGSFEPRPLIYGTVDLGSDYDPHYARDSYSLDVINQVCQGLFTYDFYSSKEKIQPQLATQLGTWSENFTEYTVTLRQDVKFHDDSFFNADDVIFSFNRLQYFLHNETPTPLAKIYQPLGPQYPSTPSVINHTRKIDEFTVIFNLNYPYAAFETLLCFSGSYILSDSGESTPLEYYRNKSSNLLIGTGPYCLLNVFERFLEFEAFDDYYLPPPQIQDMHWVLYDSLEDLHYALLRNSIDILKNPSIHYSEEIMDREFTTLTNAVNSTDITYLGMNNQKIKANIRKAIYHTIDYDMLITQIGENIKAQLNSPLPPDIKFHDPSLPIPRKNTTTARYQVLKALTLNEIDVDLIEPLSISSPTEAWQNIADTNPLLTYNYSYHFGNFLEEEFGLLLQQNLRNIGIRLNIYEGKEMNFLDKSESQQCDLFLGYFSPDFNDPSNILNNLLLNTSDQNSVRTNDPHLQSLLLEGIFETSDPIRENIYHDIQEYIMHELHPIIPLFVSNTPQIAHFVGISNISYNSFIPLQFNTMAFNYQSVPGMYTSSESLALGVIYLAGMLTIIVGISLCVSLFRYLKDKHLIPQKKSNQMKKKKDK